MINKKILEENFKLDIICSLKKFSNSFDQIREDFNTKMDILEKEYLEKLKALMESEQACQRFQDQLREIYNEALSKENKE